MPVLLKVLLFLSDEVVAMPATPVVGDAVPSGVDS
jgi:hypothetical protein